MSPCQGMASSALLMSIVVKSVLCVHLFELIPSKTCCVRLVSKVFVGGLVETCVVRVKGGHQGGFCSVYGVL